MCLFDSHAKLEFFTLTKVCVMVLWRHVAMW